MLVKLAHTQIRHRGLLPFVQVWFVWESTGSVHSDDSSKKNSYLPFCTHPTRPLRLYSGAIVAPQKFHGISNALQVTQNVVQNVEAQFCDILRLPLLPHAQSIGDQHPKGKQGVELYCSPGGLVLKGIPAFPERFKGTHRRNF